MLRLHGIALPSKYDCTRALHPAAATAAMINTAAPVKTRILVVDDITKNLQVVGTMLRNAGYEVMPTTSGAQALERVRAQLPDLILLDLMMPEYGWPGSLPPLEG